MLESLGMIGIGFRVFLRSKYRVQKKASPGRKTPFYSLYIDNQPLDFISSETVKRLRPFARRVAKTRRPVTELMRSRKPCLLRRFLLDG
jgi:hypothetical protein